MKTYVLAALFILAAAPVARAADHGDVPTLSTGIQRHDANITDLHVFTAGNTEQRLVISVTSNDAIPVSRTSYPFSPDVRFKIMIDAHSGVTFDDATKNAAYGGAITNPAGIKADVTFTVSYDALSVPTLSTTGLNDDDHGVGSVAFYSGLRDDPFIRAPRKGRNVGAIVLDMPLHLITHGRSGTILVWATAEIDQGVPGAQNWQTLDRAGRALNSMFQKAYNTADPSTDTGVPDVVIFDTTKPAAFPNGRALADDVVHYDNNLLGAKLLSTNCATAPGTPESATCPGPTANDAAFGATFPYLAAPWIPAACQGHIGDPAYSCPAPNDYYINVNGSTDPGAGNPVQDSDERDQPDMDAAGQ